MLNIKVKSKFLELEDNVKCLRFRFCVALYYTYTGMGQLVSAHLSFLAFKFYPWVRDIKSRGSETSLLRRWWLPQHSRCWLHRTLRGSTYHSFAPVLPQDLSAFHCPQQG